MSEGRESSSLIRPGSIALIGDLHSAWDDADVAYFNQSSYELLLFTGDLGASGPRDGLRIARSLARLRRPALIMPGNNDVAQYAEIAAELTYQRAQADLLARLDPELGAGPPAARGSAPPGRGSVRACGYSAHRVELAGEALTIIAGRPFAMGGSSLSFREPLERNFGVRSLAESVERLRALVDAAETEQLLFFAHNGPTGLGAEPFDLWGCDFRSEAGDWGDQDLTEAIAYARATGRRVPAVIAGHMHWALKGGGQRRVELDRDGTLYVNPARVPRIFSAGERILRQHMVLRVERGQAEAEQVLIADFGEE